jgi:hypothetical protein
MHNHSDSCNHDHDHNHEQDEEGDDLGGGPQDIQALLAMLMGGEQPELTSQEKTIDDIMHTVLMTQEEQAPFNGIPIRELLASHATEVLIGEGVNQFFAFSPERLPNVREQLSTFIKETLSDEYLADGGAQVTRLLINREGGFWTKDIMFAEALLALCTASGLARYATPREQWEELPAAQFSATGF